ncbi:MAG TPA: anti-sigma factor [Chthoniobacterales bacterium]|jgi:anti-sigma factor RsiW
MTHEEIRELIHPYVDGELDVANGREIEQHLRGCDDCRRLEQRVRTLRTTLRKSLPSYSAPTKLKRSVRTGLRNEARPARPFLSAWLLFATGTACALLILAFAFFQNARATRDTLTDELVSNHIRSLLATHLVDVVSSDQHTVKPWFDGKIDFAPEVRDLSSAGFPLEGGRLDYLHGHTVVALVYRRNKHPINLFIEPAATRDHTDPAASTRRGYNLLHWTQNGMDYWAVSDLNAAELREFAAHFTS